MHPGKPRKWTISGWYPSDPGTGGVYVEGPALEPGESVTVTEQTDDDENPITDATESYRTMTDYGHASALLRTLERQAEIGFDARAADLAAEQRRRIEQAKWSCHHTLGGRRDCGAVTVGPPPAEPECGHHRAWYEADVPSRERDLCADYRPTSSVNPDAS